VKILFLASFLLTIQSAAIFYAVLLVHVMLFGLFRQRTSAYAKKWKKSSVKQSAKVAVLSSSSEIVLGNCSSSADKDCSQVTLQLSLECIPSVANAAANNAVKTRHCSNPRTTTSNYAHCEAGGIACDSLKTRSSVICHLGAPESDSHTELNLNFNNNNDNESIEMDLTVYATSPGGSPNRSSLPADSNLECNMNQNTPVVPRTPGASATKPIQSISHVSNTSSTVPLPCSTWLCASNLADTRSSSKVAVVQVSSPKSESKFSVTHLVIERKSKR
jgi:hypothetical protein